MLSKQNIQTSWVEIEHLYEVLLPKLACGLTLRSPKKCLWGIIVEDASIPGNYKVQYFQKHGLNIHHSYSSIVECLVDALEHHCSVEDQKAIDRLQSNKEWEKGMQPEKVCARYLRACVEF
jgi:hypothetical protein